MFIMLKKIIKNIEIKKEIANLCRIKISPVKKEVKKIRIAGVDIRHKNKR